MIFTAEIGGNHGGSFACAIKMIDVAAASGATAVKFQTFEPMEMVGDPGYMLDSGPWEGEFLVDLYAKTYTPKEWLPKLFGRARQRGLVPFSTPFSKADVDCLEMLDCPWYKVASFELTDLPLIRYIARTGKPMILSTGMASLEDVREAINAAQYSYHNNGFKANIGLMVCTSAYPAPSTAANLSRISQYREEFKVNVGLSDHTEGIGVACAAATQDVFMIEKHFILSRMQGGPDAAFSMEPREFQQMTEECERAYNAMHFKYDATAENPQTKLRRSLYFTQKIPKGTKVTSKMVKTARPAQGIAPKYLEKIVGSSTLTDIEAFTAVQWEHTDAQHDTK